MRTGNRRVNIAETSTTLVSSASLRCVLIHSAFKRAATNSTSTFHDIDGNQCGLLKRMSTILDIRTWRHYKIAKSSHCPYCVWYSYPHPPKVSCYFECVSPFQMVVYSLLNSYRRYCLKNPLCKHSYGKMWVRHNYMGPNREGLI